VIIGRSRGGATDGRRLNCGPVRQDRKRHEQVEPMNNYVLAVSLQQITEAVAADKTFLSREDFSLPSARSQCIFPRRVILGVHPPSPLLM
jgi:hypothetical protein